MDDARCLCWIIHRDHGVIIAAVRFSEVAGRLMSWEWPDMPRADAEDVGHE